VITSTVYGIKTAVYGNQAGIVAITVLLFDRRAGHGPAVLLGAAVGITSIFDILSPARMELVDPKMLSGKVLAWQSIRRVSPFINSLWLFF
jgi:hypothetical protein